MCFHTRRWWINYSCVVVCCTIWPRPSMLNSAKRCCTLNKIQIISEFTNWLNSAEKGNSWAHVQRRIFHGDWKRRICEYRDRCRKGSVYGAVFQGKEVWSCQPEFWNTHPQHQSDNLSAFVFLSQGQKLEQMSWSTFQLCISMMNIFNIIRSSMQYQLHG